MTTALRNRVSQAMGAGGDTIASVRSGCYLRCYPGIRAAVVAAMLWGVAEAVSVSSLNSG